MSGAPTTGGIRRPQTALADSTGKDGTSTPVGSQKSRFVGPQATVNSYVPVTATSEVAKVKCIFSLC